MLKKFGLFWELIKYETRKLAIRLSRRISSYNTEKELQLITQIITLSEKTDPTSDEVEELRNIFLCANLKLMVLYINMKMYLTICSELL